MTGYQSSSSFLEIVTVAPAARPVLTYGTLPYTQANLKVDTPLDPITPTNSGTSITSCTSAPTLPAGLTLSQTDCSITGVPTTASASAFYTLTPLHNNLAGNTVKVALSVAPATVTALTCQSDTLCLHNLMPLWDQSDPALRAYVNTTAGLNVASDPGWCGAVSGAMVISSYLQEVQTYTGLQSTAAPSPYTAGMTQYPLIYKTMELLGTNMQYGGTPTPPNKGMIELVGKCMQTDDLYNTSWSFPYISLPWENTSSFTQGIPLGWLAICSRSGGLSDCHALAVNGVEGSQFKIYDPWGSVFDASITISYPAAAGNSGMHGTISFLSGSGLNFTSVQSGGLASIFSTDWIYGYVFTETGPTPRSQCAEP